MPAELTLGRVGAIQGRLEVSRGSQADLSRLKLRIATLSTTEHGQREYWSGESILQPDEVGEFAIPAIREGTIRLWVQEPEDFGYRADPPAEGLNVTAGDTATLVIPMRKAVQIVRQIRDAKTREPVRGVQARMQLASS